MYLSQYIYSSISIDGQWVGYLLLTIMDSPAINIQRYVFGKPMYTSLLGGFLKCFVLISLNSISRLYDILEYNV